MLIQNTTADQYLKGKIFYNIYSIPKPQYKYIGSGIECMQLIL